VFAASANAKANAPQSRRAVIFRLGVLPGKQRPRRGKRPASPESILTGIFSSVFANECTADLSLLFMQMRSYPHNDCSVMPR
jgi:hypothetical protein